MFTERLKNLTPYVPGEQPRDRRYIKLNTNENPYPPSPAVADYLKTVDVENLRRYPDPLFSLFAGGLLGALLGGLLAELGWRAPFAVYLASLLMVDPPSPPERIYLDALAQELGLEPGLVGELHATVEASRAAA